MKYKTLFRLMIKFLGVYFFIGGTVQVLYYSSRFIGGFIISYPGNLVNTSQGLKLFVIELAPYLAEMAFGAYLFRDGKWIIDKAIPSNRPYCPECGYELTHNLSLQCPECGTAVPRRNIVPPAPPIPPYS